jgi:hypothetical protein
MCLLDFLPPAVASDSTNPAAEGVHCSQPARPRLAPALSHCCRDHHRRSDCCCHRRRHRHCRRCPLQVEGQDVPVGDSFFWRTIEDDLSTAAQYYDAPALSLRNAVYHLLREQRHGFRVGGWAFRGRSGRREGVWEGDACIGGGSRWERWEGWGAVFGWLLMLPGTFLHAFQATRARRRRCPTVPPPPLPDYPIALLQSLPHCSAALSPSPLLPCCPAAVGRGRAHNERCQGSRGPGAAEELPVLLG